VHRAIDRRRDFIGCRVRRRLFELQLQLIEQLAAALR
jgi:hypothetical protein